MGCWLETQARIGQKSFRSQPIASGLFVARGYGHVIGPGVAEREIEKGSVMVEPLPFRPPPLHPPACCINAKSRKLTLD